MFGLCCFSSASLFSEINSMKKGLEDGMSWGDAKNELYELLDGQLSSHRLIYDDLIGDPSYLDKVLQQGAERVREVAKSNLHEIKSAIGLGSLS